MNLRPSGYEPDELPDCSTPRYYVVYDMFSFSKIFLKKKMDGGGFEPPKQIAADLQSVPFGHSGIHPYGIVFHKADDRTRTDNLLITNQLLCQLSHIGRLPDWQVGGGGFEPPKQFAADLQSVPFGHSGNHP